LNIATSDAYNKTLEEKLQTSDSSAENEEGKKPLSSYKEFNREAKFSRSFELPKYVDLNSIKAKLNKGILNIRLQKIAEAQPQIIEIS